MKKQNLNVGNKKKEFATATEPHASNHITIINEIDTETTILSICPSTDR